MDDGADAGEMQAGPQTADADGTNADGLKALVSDYQTRVPTEYTTGSWAPFAEALTTASGLPNIDYIDVAQASG